MGQRRHRRKTHAGFEGGQFHTVRFSRRVDSSARDELASVAGSGVLSDIRHGGSECLSGTGRRPHPDDGVSGHRGAAYHGLHDGVSPAERADWQAKTGAADVPLSDLLPQAVARTGGGPGRRSPLSASAPWSSRASATT